jgi:hypothetical protein
MTSPTPRLVAAALLTTLATGCIIDPTVLPPAPVNTSQGDRAPIIAALSHTPQTAIGKQDTVTFTVVANDPEGQPLQYTWASTKGTLTANSGMTVGWKPTRPDGSFEPGLSTVTLIVSDGRQSTTGSVNIQIDAQGQATVSETILPSPAPTATAAPASAAPAASPSPSDDGAISGKVLFEDGFETGLDQWTVGSLYLDIDGSSRWNPLSFKTLLSGAYAGKFAAVLNDPDDTVKAEVEQPEIWLFSKKTIDLTGTVLPRVRLHLKSGATPASAVSFKVFWGVPSASGIRDRRYVGGTINVNSQAGWVRKDIDLSGFKGQEGNIGVSLEVSGASNAFQGPMVDAVTVYDAGQ